MYIRLCDIKLPCEIRGIDGEMSALSRIAAEKLRISGRDIEKISIYRRSIDSRKEPCFVYSLDVYPKEGIKYHMPRGAVHMDEEKKYGVPHFDFAETKRPLIVGFGPSGMFCALVLAEAGLCPVVIERGCDVDARSRDVEDFANGGKLDISSNIQFGEGGAGTFSDGKLNTLLKDKNYRGRYVLEEFVKAGAPEEIMYENKPHIGTDRLRYAVKGIREKIISLGGSVRFETKLCGFDIRDGRLCSALCEDEKTKESLRIECGALFLGIGHSARDTLYMLDSYGIKMERKVFSVGVRIEQKQSLINAVQYGKWAENNILPPADYKLVHHCKNGKALYTFCMCPGGTVVAAASEEGGVNINGMSDFKRDGENANSALLVNIEPCELPDDGLFAGIELQRKIERKAYELAGGDYKAPASLCEDFIKGKVSEHMENVTPSYPRGVKLCDISGIFPDFVNETLREGMADFDKKIPGFASKGAVITAPEARSTCPLRILRGEDMQSSVRGLYPMGEGAGYAGGIMSAAMDGMRCAEEYMKTL